MIEGRYTAPPREVGQYTHAKECNRIEHRGGPMVDRSKRDQKCKQMPARALAKAAFKFRGEIYVAYSTKDLEDKLQ